MNIATSHENVCIKIERWSELVHILYFSFPSSWSATAVGFLAEPASEGAAGTDHTDQ